VGAAAMISCYAATVRADPVSACRVVAPDRYRIVIDGEQLRRSVRGEEQP
jgi:hypothetical protein